MSKRISRIIVRIMLVIGVVFFIVALNNPQFSWPWGNTITNCIYMTYLIAMVMLFVAPFKKKK
mgnify:CR=1 FL=1